MDEFSDFQMAVQIPTTPSVVSIGGPPPMFNGKNHVASIPPPGKSLSSGGRFPSDSSPVHSISSHPTKSDFIHSQTVLAPPPGNNKSGASVGSRLANYDLGLSGPPPTNGFQSNLDLSSTVPPFANFSKTINNSSNHHQQLQPSLTTQRNNPDLLIGEEDKYSALRMFIETDLSSTGSSVFENPTNEASTDAHNQSKEIVKPRPVLQTSNSNISNHPPPNMNSSASTFFDLNVSNSLNYNTSTVVNSNNLMGALNFTSGNIPPAASTSSGIGASDTGGDSDFADFGDFQSFTGFTPATTSNASAPPNGNISLFPTNNNTAYGNSSLLQPLATSSQLSTIPTPQKPVVFDLLSSATHGSPPIQNGTYENGDFDDDGDTEFGDFVSVEPVIPEMKQNSLPPVPAPTPLPTTSPWNKHFDLSPVTLIKQTPPPLPSDMQEDKENIEDIMNIGGYFSKLTSPLENDFTLPSTKTHHQQEPQTKENDPVETEDDFDVFTGFTGATTSFNNDILTNNSDQDKVVNCTVAKSNHVNFPVNSASASTFIRTSLIRNDKVTDIDPIKWNQSVEESNNDCTILDYSSFDRKDFSSSSGGKSKFLDVSPETRSIASLDLGNYVTVDYSETNNANNINNNNLYNPVAPIQNASLKSCSSSIPGTVAFNKGIIPADDQNIYDDYDKYQCFREECENEKERYYSEWNRCLYACKEMISKALGVFNGVSTSEVIREVVAEEKGYSYVLNILEIYRISQRIQKSALRLGIQSKIEGVIVEISNMWETLSAFLLGTCVSTEICQENLDADDCFLDGSSSPDDQLPSCGVCLCTVNTSESSQFLDYGGKIYHCKCANFWVNQVDSILPSLSYVSTIASTATNGSGSGSNCAGNTRSMSVDKANSFV